MPLVSQTLGPDVIYPALRKAGITRLAGNTPSVDQSTELIRATNRILDSLNVKGHAIFGTRVEEFALSSSQITYTIGPGGDLNTLRPIFIKAANLVQPTNPPIYTEIQIFDSRDWSMQDITALPNSWVYALWYNSTMSITSPQGCGEIWLLGQPPSNYELQLFMPSALQSNFTAVTNDFIMPDGYVMAMVNLLALECEELYPHEAVISDGLRRSAAAAVQNVEIINTDMRRQSNDAGGISRTAVPWPAAWWNAH